ncbi:hypothetical protein XENOCAPTIV_030503 [Xenoophorus captivus]|uniref:Uncharacterized protein n=1 Tax=Xenoophorus captivus TaxID=1517983 RepID=A0ABV0REI1_9TELE
MNPGVSRKQVTDEALVNMISTHCQPLSLVEDEAFRELLQLLEPSYVLPSRKVTEDVGVAECIRNPIRRPSSLVKLLLLEEEILPAQRLLAFSSQLCRK